MLFKRKAYDRLLEWKDVAQGETSILIEGARRVGKTTLAKEFAEREYRSSILVDFSVVPSEFKTLFDEKRYDIDAFLMYLSTFYRTRLYERESLIIFDEVQKFPIAREYLKHLVADGRYDYIATGSLISIKRNVENIVIPSEEESLVLNPFDFEEFLHALGEVELAGILPGIIESMRPLPDALHRRAMSLFREYMLIGGMPQAIVAFIEARDFEKVDKVKRRILSLYRNDIARYAKGYESKVVSIFDEIPSQLSKHEKRFFLSSLGKSARRRDYEDAFFWLQDAMLANLCFNATDPNVGLNLSREHTTFKCYMADTGLLVTQAFADNRKTCEGVYRDVLFDKLGINEGMLVENIVAQSLHAAGHDLYFYSRYNRENAKDTMEIDFLISRSIGKSARISPIEVKSGKGYRTTSLDKFMRKYSSRLGDAFVLDTGNIRTNEQRIYAPLYLALWL